MYLSNTHVVFTRINHFVVVVVVDIINDGDIILFCSMIDLGCSCAPDILFEPLTLRVFENGCGQFPLYDSM